MILCKKGKGLKEAAGCRAATKLHKTDTKKRAEMPPFSHKGIFAAYFRIFLDIFFGNKPDLLLPEDLSSPFLFTGARRLSLAGQPLFWLQEGANRARENMKERKITKRYFIIAGEFVF